MMLTADIVTSSISNQNILHKLPHSFIILAPLSSHSLNLFPNFVFSHFCRFSSDYTDKDNEIGIEELPLTNLKLLKLEVKMTVKGAPCIRDSFFLVNGKVVLTGVPSDVAFYQVAEGGAFLGASSSFPSSRHVFLLGVLREHKFLCLFRHKIWWMIPRFGCSGSDVPVETQMLLLEIRDDSFRQYAEDTFYLLLLPVLEGKFRATLQGNPANELQFCIESGDVHVQTSCVSEAVFINTGDDPFELIKNSIMILERKKKTFTHIKNKKHPTHLNWFGWCTWDAFYKNVTPQGIKDGLESFIEGGCPPKFLIIDDGWQDTINEFQMNGQPFVFGTQFSDRLVDIKENSKFRVTGLDIPCKSLHEFVNFIKEKYNLKLVYVWHALIGYWGGLLASSEKMQKYDPKMTYPVQSRGNVGNIRDIAMDSIEKYGVGLVDNLKIYEFYNDLHSYLSSSGVDGVKVDVQNIVETLGGGSGGRVALTRKYQVALEESVSRNFKENNIICCMSHNSDSIYSSMRSASARASEDFMPGEARFQTLHVASVAFNSLLLGEIVVPDWDMFQTDHYAADFHAAARAMGGCSVYVSDKPGCHDFKILKKLVLPDGSVLRAKYAGRPTRDCLFLDVVMDGKSLLKIWNLNKLSGVVGVFNCQGSGNWPLKDGPNCSSPVSLILSCRVSPMDIGFLGELADERWHGDCAAYAFHTGLLSRLKKDECVEVTLSTLNCEIFTISPIRVLNESTQFASLGLVDMYNSGGATESLSFNMSHSECVICIEARGCGRFGAYSSKKPMRCTVDGKGQEYTYDADNGLLIVDLEGECNVKKIQICY